MQAKILSGLDYLSARLHGRRSRLAEAQRLVDLCAIRDLTELGRAIYPASQFNQVQSFQRRLAQDLVWELSALLSCLEGPSADLLSWFLARFQVDNLKLLLRAFARRESAALATQYLLTLPRGLALDAQKLLAAGSLKEFIGLLGPGTPRSSLRQAVRVYGEQPRIFFQEVALDQGYLQELIARSWRLSGEQRQFVQTLLFQEVAAFHLLLVARAKFQYGLAPEALLPLHVQASGISKERFGAMLSAPDLLAAARFSLGRAIDELPAEHGSGEAAEGADTSILEALIWKRYVRLANRAFRCGDMGLGAVLGYVAIRRAELANLITLSEGIVAGMAPEVLRARMIPRGDLEMAVAHA